MSIAWVAAAVRTRALVSGRAGAAGAARLAAAGSLEQARELVARWSYGARLPESATVTGLQLATRETLLWQLRVLAGWAPAGGTRILRAAAAPFERDNILGLARELRGDRAGPAHDLGSLATSWGALRRAASPEDLRAALARTPWGAVEPEEEDRLAELLEAAWLLRYAQTAPAARVWVSRRAALVAARAVVVDGDSPSAGLTRRLRPLLGRAWEEARDLPALTAALPPHVRPILAGIDGAEDLWRAEARDRALTEAEATALMRSGAPRQEVVVAGLALLEVDAWRVQAAAAALEAGPAAREVLDAAA
ncbi:hypothetical protein QQX10_08085 [Demequina sp. SYSU T00039]|uniref:V/A-type H+-transporting ATPase subunit C n=1 Tax=Demequina lignilytica TaxID=3051663 RepID=A0AAW7M492_9MICO|nr:MULTISPECIES: hypothetical protein [unclassified Demequina]MDN4477524.1 hypothetical protein [Demequina sp. SYSU T00039-1]MDN4488125.1 hypothetical protein [Demequina sp. SYSU T00039]MDN4490566.1 hypothetical protein [Demequina sp. SYSU T00068]